MAPLFRYGYELTDAISAKMSLATGTLYLILKRLKDDTYVETYLVESAGEPARKYYYLTDLGNTYEKELKQEWNDFVETVNQLIQ